MKLSDVRDRFTDYYRANPTWGSLHVVLDDLNVADSNVQFCLQYAKENGDTEGEALAEILAQMSRSQRLRLARIPLQRD